MMLLAYRLVAHGIGGRTVRELVYGPGADTEGMDTDEFLTWAAYTTIEPFGEDRSDAHVAMLLAQQHNLTRTKGRTAKRVKDFYPVWYRPERREMSLDEQGTALRALYLQWGGDPAQLA